MTTPRRSAPDRLPASPLAAQNAALVEAATAVVIAMTAASYRIAPTSVIAEPIRRLEMALSNLDGAAQRHDAEQQAIGARAERERLRKWALWLVNDAAERGVRAGVGTPAHHVMAGREAAGDELLALLSEVPDHD